MRPRDSTTATETDKKQQIQRQHRLQIQQILLKARDQNQLLSISPSLLRVYIPTHVQSITTFSNDEYGRAKNENIRNRESNSSDIVPPSKTLLALIEHFTSPLPSTLLDQCLELFQVNMAQMYSQSSWGLDIDAKRRELMHENARFLIILEKGITPPSEQQPHYNSNHSPYESTAIHSTDSTTNRDTLTVHGFVHYRFETDDETEDDSSPTHLLNPLLPLPLPVTYLYELQIRPTFHTLGLGTRLMSIIEKISLQAHMTKVMLTVFKNNTRARQFYEKMGYLVDECSPSSNTTTNSNDDLSQESINGEEDEECCDYEILSKNIG